VERLEQSKLKFDLLNTDSFDFLFRSFDLNHLNSNDNDPTHESGYHPSQMPQLIEFDPEDQYREHLLEFFPWLAEVKPKWKLRLDFLKNLEPTLKSSISISAQIEKKAKETFNLRKRAVELIDAVFCRLKLLFPEKSELFDKYRQQKPRTTAHLRKAYLDLLKERPDYLENSPMRNGLESLRPKEEEISEDTRQILIKLEWGDVPKLESSNGFHINGDLWS